ncbi:MAG: alanine racemase [Candidatus Eremiobacteraeota bacterium]|nr:alanine racemase [Candidatus Eremiobacteraeota bacterium]
MRPEIALDGAVVAANARAWEAFAGVPVYAVVKGDGYGWGYRALVDALEGHVGGYCVSDEDELGELRRYSATRAIVLGRVPPERLADVLDSDALPTIASEAEVGVAARWALHRKRPLRIRVGLRPATSWSGLSLDELRGFAPLLARAAAQVELWSHVVDWERRAAHFERFEDAMRLLRDAGVRIAGTDFASTFPLAADGAHGDKVRIGVGLFGATGGFEVPGVRCALRVVAAVTDVERVSAATAVGYGGVAAEPEATIVTARCGYADGLPRSLAGSDDILSIGMQYITKSDAGGVTNSHTVLLDAATDLDAFAASAGRLPHEIVTAFGNAASARATRRQHR